MDKQQMVSQDPVPELKSERVQEEIALIENEPFRISLKSERVQESLAVGGTAEKVSFAYELSFNQMRKVTLDLEGSRISVSLYNEAGLQAA